MTDEIKNINIMALFYKPIQRCTQPGDPESPNKWYIVLKSLGMKKEKEVTKLNLEY